MGSEKSENLPARNEAWVTRARELFLKSLEAQKDVRDAALSVGEVAKEVKEGGYYAGMGFATFDAYTRGMFRLSADQVYRDRKSVV